MGERVLKEGYLMKAPDVVKYIHNSKKWQRKWFSLDNSGDLSFYESEKSSKVGGVLHLWQCSLLFDPKSKGIQHLFCLGLELGEYTSYLKAESAPLFNDWLKLFKEYVEKCDVEEIPEAQIRHGTITGGGRTSSVSGVQTRTFSASFQSRFERKEGYMAKTGGNNKGWKDRYFILDKGRLSYYKNEKSTQGDALGSIDLFDCSSVSKTSGRKGYGFDLQLPSRVFNLSTETESDLKEWMTLVSCTLDVIDTIKGSSLKSGRVKSSENRLSVESDISVDNSTEERKTDISPSHSGQEDVLEGSGAKSVEGTGPEDIVQLLEAEVDALRSKVSSLEGDLRSSSVVNSQLQNELVKERRTKEKVIKELEQDKEEMALQVEQLESTKEELESINDSIQAQLEEQQDKAQVLEEEQVSLRHELEDSQASVNAAEEELSETQMKLQEIEDMARRLEEALRKRGDSEPPPDLSSLRSLNMSYKAKMGEEFSSSLGIPVASTALIDEEPLGSSAETPPPPPPPPALESLRPEDVEHLVHEERLKWQVEVVNVRRELESRLERERRLWEEESGVLKQEISRLEKELGGITPQLVGKLQAKLEMANERAEQLSGESSAALEKVTQLLAEKEKALADLKTIRKTNKTMEKKLSENEDLLRSASRGSMSSGDGNSPLALMPEDKSHLVEAEKKITELLTQLNNVERERDHLKVHVEELTSRASDKEAGSSVAMAPSPAFNFFNKTSATVGTSEYTVGGAPSTAPLRNGWASSSTEHPPPKPRKPPKELVDQFSLSTNSGNVLKRQPLSFDEGTSDSPSTIRSRTKSMLQTFFARR